jgi:hypothetical protein
MTKLERERLHLVEARKKEIRAFLTAKGLAIPPCPETLTDRFMENGDIGFWINIKLPADAKLLERRNTWEKAYRTHVARESNKHRLARVINDIRRLDGVGWDKIMHEITKDGSFHG